jgi:hypothetical protein
VKTLFKAMAVIGAVLVLGTAGTDFYLSEMGQSISSLAWVLTIVGMLMMIPALFIKEGE